MYTSIAGKSSFTIFIIFVFMYISIFFRFTELDLEGRYSAVREAVGLNIRQAATIVNQTFLLWRLHDTRICDPLLEPVNNEDLSNTDDGIVIYL